MGFDAWLRVLNCSLGFIGIEVTARADINGTIFGLFILFILWFPLKCREPCLDIIGGRPQFW